MTHASSVCNRSNVREILRVQFSFRCYSRALTRFHAIIRLKFFTSVNLKVITDVQNHDAAIIHFDGRQGEIKYFQARPRYHKCAIIIYRVYV